MRLQEMTEAGLLNRLDQIDAHLRRCGECERETWDGLRQAVVDELDRRTRQEIESYRACQA